MLRLAPLALAGLVMGLADRLVGPTASRTWLRPDPWREIWDAEGVDDDDPEPDPETLDAHARIVRAHRAIAAS